MAEVRRLSGCLWDCGAMARPLPLFGTHCQLPTGVPRSTCLLAQTEAAQHLPAGTSRSYPSYPPAVKGKGGGAMPAGTWSLPAAARNSRSFRTATPELGSPGRH